MAAQVFRLARSMSYVLGLGVPCIPPGMMAWTTGSYLGKPVCKLLWQPVTYSMGVVQTGVSLHGYLWLPCVRHIASCPRTSLAVIVERFCMPSQWQSNPSLCLHDSSAHHLYFELLPEHYSKAVQLCNQRSPLQSAVILLPLHALIWIHPAQCCR